MFKTVMVATLGLMMATPSFAQQLWTEKAQGAGVNVQIPSLGPLVDEIDGAVLFISTSVDTRAAMKADPRMDFFRRFGVEVPDMPPQQGQGTGFLIHPDGYALTNNHVIEGATEISVRIGGASETYEAKLVGTDENTDVALIKLKKKGNERFPVIPLGNSEKLRVGDFVVAIGNPFGLSQSVSMGIISARSRRDINPSGRRGLYDFLQTDASINPGNSGGPLINFQGEVVGINTAINAAGQGIGFAIPINLVKRLVGDLKKNGRVSRAYIGVSIREVDPRLASGFGLKRARGALVAEVSDGSPAAKAGLKPGDVIVSFDGKPIKDASDLPLLAGFAGIGKRVNLEVMREKRTRKIGITLAALPGDKKASRSRPEKTEKTTGKMGLSINDLDEKIRRSLKLRGKIKGAHVVRVSPGSPANAADIRKDDVIISVNGARVTTANGFIAQVKRVRSKSVLKILLLRDGRTLFTALPKP